MSPQLSGQEVSAEDLSWRQRSGWASHTRMAFSSSRVAGFGAVCKILQPKATVQVTFLLGAFECVAGPGTRDIFRCGGSEYDNVSPSW